MDDTQEVHQKSLVDYVMMFWRRRVIMAVTIASVLVVGTLIVYLLPPVYQSDSLVLIESQQVPEKFVQATITSFADERIEVIRQRALTTGNVLGMIKKFSLFPREQSSLGPSQLADLFRSAVVVAPVNTQGSGKRITIAFRLSFMHGKPKVAQAVNNELLTLFLGENVKSRSARATETTDFLRSEANRFQVSITTLEGKIADFKQKNREALPELAQANTQELDRLNLNYREIVGQIEMVRGRLGMLESQLALATNNAPGDMEGGALWQLEQELAQLLTHYTEKHPSVIRLRERIQEAKSAPPSKATTSLPTDNPATLQVRSQLNATQAQLQFLLDNRAAAEKKLIEVQERISMAPRIEQEYNNLLRDLDNLRNKYQDLRDKELQAKIAQNLEEGQMGERFSVIEPPTLPEKPASPDRVKLMLLVLAASAAAGVGIVLAMEQLQPVLWGTNAIGAVLGGSPLAIVPLIELPGDPEMRRKRRLFWGSIAIVGVVMVLGIIHLFLLDLQLVWLALGDRLGLGR
jgi:polysaccharide biosynthesis transport protein